MNELRTNILIDSEIVSSRRRFGLFSQPPPIAIGDDSPTKILKHPKGQDGKPQTKPPQMLAGSCKSGMTKSSYLSVPKSIHIGDQYKERFRVQREYQKKQHSKAPFHELQFKPSFSGTTLHKSSYRYMEQKPLEKKQMQRDQTGKVKTKLPNVITHKTSRLDWKLLTNSNYESEPYDRPEMFRKRQKQIKQKKNIHEGSFRSMSHSRRTFSKDSLVFGQDRKAKQMLKNRKNRRTISDFGIVRHETNFRPARRGHGDTIGKYPQNIKSKMTEQILQKKITKNNTVNPQAWKYTNFGYSRPTPSITSMAKNLSKKINKK